MKTCALLMCGVPHSGFEEVQHENWTDLNPTNWHLLYQVWPEKLSAVIRLVQFCWASLCMPLVYVMTKPHNYIKIISHL